MRNKRASHRSGRYNQMANASSNGNTFGSCTNVGCVRDHNEDSLLVRPPLYVVADGMGGHAAGEVASEIAVQTIANQAPRHLDADALGYAVESANAEILRAANNGEGRLGMGTTVTAAMVEGERLLVAQVGDSRAYLLHRGALQQITRDHSLMADLIESGEITPEEAKTHPQRSVITRALGAAPYTRPDLYELNVSAGDRLLLCSDGLSGMVNDNDIAITMNTIDDPQRCADRLIKQAIIGGGQDNITAVVVDITGFAGARLLHLTKKTKRTLIIIAILLVLALGGAFFGISNYIHNSAYLTDENGYVAIYQGLPEGFMGQSYSELYEVTNIPTAQMDKITGGMTTRLKRGAISVDSVSEAKRLISEYEEKLGIDASASGAASGTNTAAAASSSASGSTSTAAASSATSGTSASNTQDTNS